MRMSPLKPVYRGMKKTNMTRCGIDREGWGDEVASYFFPLVCLHHPQPSTLYASKLRLFVF